MRTNVLFFLAALVFAGSAAAWEPVRDRILTRWADEVSPDAPLPEYPRPQMTRPEWRNLNGVWSFTLASRDAARPAAIDREILVPFAVESALSGVAETVTPDQAVWYRRTFEVPQDWRGRRTLLHFGAVDWEATVWVNGVELGTHRGGYTPFSFDATRALLPGDAQQLVVRVWDPTSTGSQPRGKQLLEPEGIWYTPVTGIWQTVWIEPVADLSITRLEPIPDIDAGTVTIHADLSGIDSGLELRVRVLDGGTEVVSGRGPDPGELTLRVPAPKLWSPDSPHLYDLEVELLRGGQVVDRVESYFAMRKISMDRDAAGDMRFQLNNEPLFHLGPLDQGWWPDGLYTAPTDEALAYDIEITKRLGFNMARKHVKVEPARWYYHCDRLGLMVWQDMPSAAPGRDQDLSFWVRPWDEKDAPREGVSAAQFEAELAEMIDAFRFFPSIVMWVPFNEGWGQYDTARIAAWVKQTDPTRLVNAVSGWTDRGVGDVYDTHIYPGPGLQHGENRAAVLGEFGGLGWPVDDHLWWNKRNWGYRTFDNQDALNARYAEVWGDVVGPYARGAAAAIYTQTTDVEGEVNGLMTYDRALVKFDERMTRQVHAPFLAPPKQAVLLAPNSQHEKQTWKLTASKPSDGWTKPGFDDAAWQAVETPLRSSPDDLFLDGGTWADRPLWIRREFDASGGVDNLWLEIQHSPFEGAVYLNGVEIDRPEGHSRREYRHRDVSEHAGLIRPGKNVLAIEAAPLESRDERRDLDAGLYTLR